MKVSFLKNWIRSCLQKTWRPGDSSRDPTWSPNVRGHLTYKQGHLTIPQRAQAELPGRGIALETIQNSTSAFFFNPGYVPALKIEPNDKSSE